MKKFFIAILAVATAALMLVGCAPTTVPQAEIGTLPWVASRNFKAETCTYKVTKYVGDGTEAVSTDGQLVYDVRVISDPQSEYNSCYQLTMDFHLTYGNSEFVDANFRGKTDRMHSEAIFRRDTLSAVYVKKTAENMSDPSLSYSYEVDYTHPDENDKLTATFNSNGETKTLKFNRGEYFDNDYMYYYVRALKKMGGSLSENINIVNWYDCFVANKFSVYPLIVSCSNNLEAVKTDPSLIDNFVSTEDGNIDKQENLVNCYNVSIIISGIKTGPELLVAFSTCDYELDGDRTKFVPLKYKTRETISSGYTTFYTESILSSYSIE